MRSPRPRSSGWRRFWILGGAVLTVVVVLFNTFQVVSWIAREDLTVGRTFSAAELADVRVVEIRNTAGRVQVTGTDGSEARVDATGSRGIFETRHRQEVEGDRLVLTGSCPEVGDHCRLDYVVRIPADLPVVVDGAHGRTELSDLSAPVSLEVGHAGVELARLSGDLDITVRFGTLRGVQLTGSTFDARIEHSSGEISFERGPDVVDIETRFSGVDVWMPSDAGPYAITTTSNFGAVDNQLRTDPASPQRIEVDNQFGALTLRHVR